MDYVVTEVCPHCGEENTVHLDPKEFGYEMYCVKCGRKIMLCSECPELNVHGRCDWKADFNWSEGRCKMKATSKLIG